MSMFQYIPAFLLDKVLQESKEVPKSIQRSAKRVTELYTTQAKGMNKLFRDINAYDISNETEWQSYFEDRNVSHILPLTTISFEKTNTKVKCQVIVVYSKQAKSEIVYDNANQYLLIYDTNAKKLSENKLEALIIKQLTKEPASSNKAPVKYKKIPIYNKNR